MLLCCCISIDNNYNSYVSAFHFSQIAIYKNIGLSVLFHSIFPQGISYYELQLPLPSGAGCNTMQLVKKQFQQKTHTEIIIILAQTG